MLGIDEEGDVRFMDRVDAGRLLGSRLIHLRGQDVVVVGLPRGGVPVAAEVAVALDAPLDVIVVRKLGVPFQPELGMGAIGEGGIRVLNSEVLRLAGVSSKELSVVEERERAELERRARLYRGDLPAIPLTGRTVVVVDDGLATGSTATAACQVCRARGAGRVVLAVPVAPQDWTVRLAGAADELICVQTPEPFFAIGQFYVDFSQTTDDEVARCLERGRRLVDAADGDDPPMRDEHVDMPAGRARLAGHLNVPQQAIGVVVFAHGSGSGRHSPRNRLVAAVLNRAGLATLLLDLLTPQEELDRANVFDVEMLAGRLVEVTAWLGGRPETRDLPVGYFGASTGAAAALWAAANAPVEIAAVVSRGGRPDLAESKLSEVTAPTLLIVGERDHAVVDLNRRAQNLLGPQSRLAIVPGATHLFEEPGTLQTAAQLAREWFISHMTS
jgi:putative phosphoribosyl transferase